MLCEEFPTLYIPVGTHKMENRARKAGVLRYEFDGSAFTDQADSRLIFFNAIDTTVVST